MRNRVVEGTPPKSSSIFIKENIEKVSHDNKKIFPEIPKIKEKKSKRWELKKRVHFQNEEVGKVTILEKVANSDLVKKKVSSTILTPSPLDINMKNIAYDPIDIILVLSQIIVKVPLVEIFKIEENKRKALSWLGGIQDNEVSTQIPSNTLLTPEIDKEKEEIGACLKYPKCI